MESTLNRFIVAQAPMYARALEEIQQGRKQSHWMWFIFPQIAGLGYSETSKFYSIRNLAEARDYLHHEILGYRLIEISEALLNLQNVTAQSIFGSPDDLKLKSSMTLFSLVEGANPIFKLVLDKYFGGRLDNRTVQLV